MKRFFTAILLLSGLLIMQPAYAQTTSPGQQLNVPQGDASLNWAGYVADTASDYTSVSGSWIVTSVSNATSGTGSTGSPQAADATWVGIGGVKSTDLIQAGTQAIVQNGTVTYNAWVETLPGFSQTVPLSVASGDSMTASVTQQSPGVWLVTIKDNSTGQSYQATLNYNSSLSSAEWVEEMVSNGNNTFRPLDSFGGVSFTGGSAVVNGMSETISQSGAQPLQMINGQGSALATTSALGGDGASFSVTRTSNSPDTRVGTPTLRRGWHVLQTATSTGATPVPMSFITRRGGVRFYEFRLFI